MTSEAFAQRMTGGYTAPILAEPVGGPVPVPDGSPFGPPPVEPTHTGAVLSRVYRRDDKGRFGSGSGGIRQALQDAQTTEAVAGVLKSEVSAILGHDVRVGLAGLDVEVARVHAEGILRGAEAYPEARLGAVNTYGPDSPLGHYGGLQQDAYAVTLRGEEIWFNTDHGDMESTYGIGFRESMGYSDASGHLAGAPGDLTRVGTHEFGHVVDATTDGRMSQAAARIAKSLAGPDVDRKAFTRVSVSRYAATSAGELVAEAFADVVSRGRDASMLSQQIFSEARGLAGDLYDVATPTFLLRLARSRERLKIAARTYKRDKDGKFSSGSGEGSAVADQAALAATPYGIGDGDAQLDAALDGYAGSNYAEINSGLRAGKPSPSMQHDIDTLDAGMQSSRLTADIQVGRGIRNPQGVFGDAWNGSDVTGLQWTDRGFASSTANSARTRSGRSFFSGDEGVAMTITVPKGTGALAIGRRDRGQFGEMEVLLDRGLSYRVVRDNGVVEGIRMLDVEVVP